MARTWKFEQVQPNIHRFRMDYGEQFVLVISDIHWDNPKCNRSLLRKHLDKAVELDAPIIVVGDLFCAMQGKYDKRASKSEIRQEHQSGTYLDSLVRTAADWFEPYKNNLAVIGYGNHETSILKSHETDILGNLSFLLRERGGITTTGGYGGWIRFRFRHHTKSGSLLMYYHHGFGGGGQSTKGVNQFATYNQHVRADMVVAGHIHQRSYHCDIVATLTNKEVLLKSQVDSVRCSTYKDEFGTGMGYHEENGRGPRPMGGWWLRFHSGPNESVPDRQWIPTEGC